MDPAEYANLDRLEQEHWYYAGKREFVRRWLMRVRSPRPSDRLLDCGAGTGRFGLEMQSFCSVLVLDTYEESLRMLRTRFQPHQVLTLTEGEVPLPDQSLDYITAMDVLEHISDDAAAVRGFHRLLKPGGIAIITVPASPALLSDWDTALHHFRRYRRSELRQLFSAPDWEIIHVNYTNVAAYPAVWLMRRWRRWFPWRSHVRVEDRIPGPVINAWLRRLFVASAFWSCPMPTGVSLLLVARKRSLS